jgi:uncharacterized protein YecE (DUF72 family)
MGAWIGTSGWSYGHWREVFYPGDLPQAKWLEHYAAHFDSVELNASFYHLPREATFAQWRARTPEGFTFAVKASRFITHRRRLADCAEPLERFFTAAARLEEKLAAVLFQLPPSFEKDTALLAAFLDQARRAAPAAARLAFEFRSGSWLAEDSCDVLKKHNAALVFADWGKLSPMEPVTADFVYLRRHGPKSDYASAYSAEDIRRDARAAKGWLAGGLDLFAYYNNDFGGHAVRDARSLADSIKG